MKMIITLVIILIIILIASNTNHATQDIIVTKAVYRVSLRPGQGAGGYYNQYKCQGKEGYEISSSWSKGTKANYFEK